MVDLDGTLVDTLGDFDAAIAAMLGGLSLPPLPRADVERYIGKGSEHLIRSALAHVMGGDADRAGAHYGCAWDLYQAHYERINGRHSQVFPGVLEGLEGLRAQGLALACLTNKPLAYARTLLEAKGLAGFFGPVFGGDSFERKKPDPLPLVRTCEALGTAVGRTLMLGDSGNDAQAARGAGCPVVLVTYGYNHGEPVHRVDADGFVDSLAELVAPR